jgi:subtilisin-like proprotein convertase family protein/subtilisin family serine protease
MPARAFAPGVWILQAPDALSAARHAAELAVLPGVMVAHPVRRQVVHKHYPYARPPHDPHFFRQWNFENVDPTATILQRTVDVNVRSAWPFTRGEGVIVACVDDGQDVLHKDLASRVVPELNFNGHTLATNGAHSANFQYHGTAVAGLVAASTDNNVGGTGVAPLARLASWVIFDASDNIPDEETMAAIFQRSPDTVQVQNHSWGNSDFEPLVPGLLEQLAVSNAATLGRGGRGIVMVRSAGNTRIEDYSGHQGVGDVNLDTYANHPYAILIGAVRQDGRVASYSNPGACLVAVTPSGDPDAGFVRIFTTDPTGTAGLSVTSTADFPDRADYAVGSAAFYGTSASAPQGSGVAALMLSANPKLGYRDVQQILALTAWQSDPDDPDLVKNGAGLWVSHNTGFGLIDAGAAVRAAMAWSNRPPLVRRSFTNDSAGAIPDDGLRVEVTGAEVQDNLASIPASGGVGLHPDVPTSSLPLFDAGLANGPITEDLAGRGALVQRRPNSFASKIGYAADAGAEFVIVANDEGTTSRLIMSGTDFTTIPSVMIGKSDGEALRILIGSHPEVRARLHLVSLVRELTVPDTLICEHVGVRLKLQHPRAADLRVTLRSPAGTISILQRPNFNNTSPALDDYTYWSTRHFFESSAGTWSVNVTDEATGQTGTIQSVELILHGTPIVDADADGLDDTWERQWFGNLEARPGDDPDRDGLSNAHEQLMGTDPTRDETLLSADASFLTPSRVRLGWSAVEGRTYEVLSSDDPAGPFSSIATVPGHFPEAGIFVEVPGPGVRSFRIQQHP